ncbi:hypothetical protein Q4610_18120 [Sphingobium sp. HBC34]|uniref:HTH marR-type domain-containing protein n=1 Tax=Sphingobium cyanobacteriorum TaxID=3063954 RepID=A0ABT8ZQZ2_9SPHN|nr:hypothetical protein [Sphingobium sp. HBC34]MDO7836967.1 hypothetical protein [Sphingobium sp. HBC34]
MKLIEWPVGASPSPEWGDIRAAIINLCATLGLRLTDARDVCPPQGSGAPPLPLDPLAVAQAWAEAIADQAAIFGPDLCVNGSWNMLLDLYISGRQKRRISVSSLCIASGVPPTTALRHMMLLEAQGLIERMPDRVDLRRRYVDLTTAGREKVERILIAAGRRTRPASG